MSASPGTKDGIIAQGRCDSEVPEDPVDEEASGAFAAPSAVDILDHTASNQKIGRG